MVMKKKEKKEQEHFERYKERYKDFETLEADTLAINLVKPNSKVLSCGCGHGREVYFLVKERNCDVTAIDNQERMINLSKTTEPNADYYLADMKDFKTREKQDYILCIWNGINALLKNEDKIIFIKTCEENLKVGGKLILVTSNMFSYWRHFFSELRHWNNYNYLPWKINSWFKGINFEIQKIKVGRFNIIVAKKIK